MLVVWALLPILEMVVSFLLDGVGVHYRLGDTLVEECPVGGVSVPSAVIFCSYM